MEKSIKCYIAIFVIIATTALTGCKKVPVITTSVISNLDVTTAISGGNITDEGSSTVIGRGVCWSTGTTPTIADSKTSDGAGVGSFSSLLTGLKEMTVYFIRAYATNSVGTGYGMAMSFKTTPSNTVTDIDGNIYNKVTIGTQVWMAENLKTTKYNNGDAIPNITDNTAWTALSTGAYCDYSNTPAYSTTYGKLYNWYTVDNNAATKVASNGGRNVCPTGWHVPSYTEWTTLITYIGGDTAGGKLKEFGTSHWTSPNTGATNETGFIALPSGNRSGDGAFYDVGSTGGWWSSTEGSAMLAYYPYVYYSSANVYRSYYDKRGGFSVRCLRDF